jgi:hypothetical protein
MACVEGNSNEKSSRNRHGSFGQGVLSACVIAGAEWHYLVAFSLHTGSVPGRESGVRFPYCTGVKVN